MDALCVYIQHAVSVNDMINMQDVATLRCVSKDTNVIIKTCIDESEFVLSAIMQNTASDLKVPCIEPSGQHVIDLKCLFKQLLRARRLYGDHQQTNNFIGVLNEFTSITARTIWTDGLVNLPTQRQLDTLHVLLNFFANDDLQQNILIVFLLMYFIHKYIDANMSTIHDRDVSVFANRRVRKIILSKCEYLIKTLNEEITLYPHFFVSRVIRKIRDVKRLLQTL